MPILIAETDMALLREMQDALQSAGYEVISANDGMGAWGYLASSTPPDLLITRFRLGAGAPPGTALGLHAQFSQPRIPVIYIPADTAHAEHADPRHGAVLIKPFAAAELVATVRQLLAKPATAA